MFLCILLFSFCKASYGFDISGLQPIAPYGVFSTFSADSLLKGKIAVSPGAEISKEPDFYRFLLKTAYGITNNIELEMTVPYIYNWANSVDGFEDVAFGLKHRFFEEGKYGPSIAYMLNASLPSGRDDFSTDGRFGAGLILSKRVGPVNGHVNLFYEKPGTGKLEDEISFVTGLDFAAAHNFKILAELLCKKSHFSKEIDQVEGRIGYRIKTTDIIYTTVGAGFDFKKRNPEYRIIFSISFVPPPKKKKIKKIYEEE
ncbi:MAG: hypothetical protein AB1638_07175 [Nitrospirota bacterium]